MNDDVHPLESTGEAVCPDGQDIADIPMSSFAITPDPDATLHRDTSAE
jgi:hypothetical protein